MDAELGELSSHLTQLHSYPLYGSSTHPGPETHFHLAKTTVINELMISETVISETALLFERNREQTALRRREDETALSSASHL